jgi:hypothetical protein
MATSDAASGKKLVYKRPVEVVDDARPSSAWTVAVAIGLCTLATLVLGSKPLLDWSNSLPIGPASDFILYVAQAWQDAMDKLGITAYASAIRELLHRLQDLR